MTTTVTDAQPDLTAADRCDRCGARAQVRVGLIAGDLLFCGADFNRSREAIISQAITVHDEREWKPEERASS